MIALSFENAVKRFPGATTNAVDHVSLDIEEGELVTILGASGSGKTTLLKMVNRLIEPDEGTIRLFGEDIKDRDPVKLRHGIGYVIQQIGLFPHMTVRENIATVPKILKWDKARIDARADELLALVNLDPAEFRGRYPAQLSGGQQQRVGLARALAADPAVMLMDEPFGAIDAINRSNLQAELLSIHGKHKKTYLFVTHDVGEALKLGGKVLVMDRGRVKQFDAPQRIVDDPADDFVRELLDSASGLRERRRGMNVGIL
ncbi:MAG: ABC transporter ATP-binding protein [Clostridiales Family XIII bacterium]|jgi:osmoprotectant transport system ATP-binding protein|nr:ABC transporter ATP-binding protein [Clostridiales Family XIII bacterium]